MATKHGTSKTRSGSKDESSDKPQNDPIDSTVLLDLRRQPRVATSFRGKAFTDSGEHLHVVITDVSLSGLRLEGSRQVVDALLADGVSGASDTNSHISLAVHFSVPTASDHIPVKVHCKIINARLAGKDTSQIGMKFVTFEEGRTALIDYLEYRTAPL